jgi:hypothetical protein
LKPKDRTTEAIVALARRVAALQQDAAQQYRPVVEEILRTGNHDAMHIERTLDGLLDFCGCEPVLAMYRQLCRHYWAIDPSATADYVEAYRERWDSDEGRGRRTARGEPK